MTQFISTQQIHRLLWLASGLLLLALLSGSMSLSQAAGGETSGRYRPGETPAGLTMAEWAQVTAHLRQAQQAVNHPAQQAYVKASNTGAWDLFGYVVALSGDTLAVGAWCEDSSASGVNPPGGQAEFPSFNAGAVYVFTRSGGVWSQQAYLKASNTGRGDSFGWSVALSGDTLAVGAIGEASSTVGVNPPGGQADNSAPEAGAVYVFTRSGGVWSQQAYLKASNTEAWDRFGYAVALSGDTLAVGAYREASSAGGVNPPGGQADNSVLNAGAVYVFTRSGSTWSQQAYVKASNTEAFDRFGWSVALTGNTLAVGAIGEASSATGINGNQRDNSATAAGAVYVFTRSGGVWSQQAYLKASNTEAFDYFGRVVALSGDTLAVGAYQEDSSAVGVNGNQADNSALNAGAVYVFTQSGSAWSQQAYLKASNTGAVDQFGGSVALAGDTLAVGAIGEDSSGVGVNGNQGDNPVPQAGAVYVFTRGSSVWSQQAYVKASNTSADDLFGGAVALSGDTLAVGRTRRTAARWGSTAIKPIIRPLTLGRPMYWPVLVHRGQRCICRWW